MRIFSGYGAGDTSRYLWDTVEGNGAVVGGGRANPGRDRVRPRGVVILRSKPKKKVTNELLVAIMCTIKSIDSRLSFAS